MRRRALVVLLALAAAMPAACGGGGTAHAATRVIRMHYSRYLPASLTVKAGETVTFDVVNTDPIAHEFIIGTAAQQLAHERGDPNDPHTGPGEASIPGGKTARVRFTFPTAGTLQYACHRPGHYRYGMLGTITVET